MGYKLHGVGTTWSEETFIEVDPIDGPPHTCRISKLICPCGFMMGRNDKKVQEFHYEHCDQSKVKGKRLLNG